MALMPNIPQSLNTYKAAMINAPPTHNANVCRTTYGRTLSAIPPHMTFHLVVFFPYTNRTNPVEEKSIDVISCEKEKSNK
jgi:hypothetical protein